ncbi:S8 family peptidase [Bacillus sp. ISL-57]|uniref:S8 family peptidase n=1 Tax=Bacillus sp. ISL-57 TaxID=2819135 RepID=UPI001BED0BF9|nr:S8 family peptidase [Bacillus sp. ISL-57]MBT2719069.1 S8 family peptidase [Bacillus sp. ISL-57]
MKEYNLDHLILRGVKREKFKSPKTVSMDFNVPVRNREEHVSKIRKELENLKKLKIETEKKEASLVTFYGKENHDLKFESIGDKKSGVEVIIQGEREKIPFAVARVPKKGFDVVEKKLTAYEKETTANGKPKNNDLVASIDSIKETLIEELYVGDKSYWPDDKDKKFWWEIWLLGGSLEEQVAESSISLFITLVQRFNSSFVSSNILKFGERQVVLINATIRELEMLVTESNIVVEIHNPSRVVIHEMIKEGIENFEVSDLLQRLNYPKGELPRISVIDTGINNSHPLLEELFSTNSLHSIDPSSPSTGDEIGHGTEVGGIAAFGDLTDLLKHSDTGPIELTHYLESVKIPLGDIGTEHLWGMTTINAINTIEEANPGINRIFNMSIGAKHDDPLNGKPTSWSAAVDMICYNNGEGRLMTIAAGNVSPKDKEGYPTRNLATEIDDPAQSLNAITIGGYTKLLDHIPLEGDYQEYEILAEREGLSPHSATGPTKHAIKPEIVLEAGNVIVNGNMFEDFFGGISLLSTNNKFLEELFVNTSQTSMAAPQAANYLAKVWYENPGLRNATIRGLLIHSASWSKSMIQQFPSKNDRIRSFGYGIPDLEFARKSANSAVTLIAEDEIKCGYEDRSSGKKKIVRDMNYYRIPWPSEVLLQLGSSSVELRITLSFFIEPNPKFYTNSYEGASLSWELQGPTESDEEFFKRINKEKREDGEKGFKSGIDWEIGSTSRNRGTVQSDRWKTTAAELASCGYIAVFPKHGWWTKNPKNRPDPSMQYSLIVSVISEDENIDLYVAIQNEISVEIDS